MGPWRCAAAVLWWGTRFAPVDEIAQRAAAAMEQADAAGREAGVRLLDVGAGRARTGLTVGARHLNGHGICHGGYVFLLADTAFACACNTHGPVTVAAGAEISFVAAGRLGDHLVATATERTRYGRNGIYDVTVARDGGEVVAEFRGHSRELGTPLLG